MYSPFCCVAASVHQGKRKAWLGESIPTVMCLSTSIQISIGTCVYSVHTVVDMRAEMPIAIDSLLLHVSEGTNVRCSQCISITLCFTDVICDRFSAVAFDPIEIHTDQTKLAKTTRRAVSLPEFVNLIDRRRFYEHINEQQRTRNG